MLAVYLALLFLIALFSAAKPNTLLNNNINAKFLSTIILCIVSIDVIFREQIHDTEIYILSFKESLGKDLGYLISILPFDTMWIIFQWVISKLTDSSYIFLAIIWLIFLFGLLKLLNAIFTSWQLLFVLFSYTLFAFFYSYATMALRQGMAISFILMAISFLINNGTDRSNNIKALLCLVVSILFHWTSFPFALATWLLFKFEIKLRYLIVIWITFALMFVLGIQDNILSPIFNLIPKLDIYTSTQVLSNYSGVNRNDFFLFSAIWIIYCVVFYIYFCKNGTYKQLIKLYVSFNSIFLLFGFVAYSDRIAGYSWFLIPVIVWYPLLKREKYHRLVVAAMLLGFVLVGFLSGTYYHYSLDGILASK